MVALFRGVCGEIRIEEPAESGRSAATNSAGRIIEHAGTTE
jgi:hypothetical protein